MSASPAAPPRSDVRQKESLVGTSSSLSGGAGNELSPDDYLRQVGEDYNARVDADVAVLADGLAELLKMSKVEGKDHYTATREALQAQIRADGMIRAAQSLLSLCDHLKRLHVLNDPKATERIREDMANAYSASAAIAEEGEGKKEPE